jgi:hypothetical protein
MSRMDTVNRKRPRSGCASNKCMAFNIGDRTYGVKHRQECGQYSRSNRQNDERGSKCQSPKAPADRILSALENETFPLALVRCEDGQVKIEILPYQKGMEYIAISHVWSDGLVNPLKNGLPSCQLCFVNNIVPELARHSTEQIGRPTLFRIDIIYVPLSPPEKRKVAIKRIAKTFTHASAVLVLSAELESRPISCSAEESLVRVYCSKWMTRLWTLNEDINASALWVQFSNGPAISGSCAIGWMRLSV